MASSETMLETVVFSAGCQRLALALVGGAGVVILTITLILSLQPAWQGVGVANLHPLALLVDPAQPATVYAGTEQGGVMVTHDNGATWTTAQTGLPANTVLAALLAEPGTGALLAGTDHGVFTSGDGGQHWTALGNGLPANMTVDALAAPANGILLAGGTAGLFRATDGGHMWASSSQGLPAQASIYGLTVTAGRVFAALIPGGVYASADGGQTWHASSQGLPTSLNIFAVLARSPTRLLAGTSQGIYASADGGASWAASSAGLGTTRAISLAADPRDASTLLAGTDDGVYQSSDGGRAWHKLGGLPTPPGQAVGVVAIAHPANGPAVSYAAADRLYRYPQPPNATRTTLQVLGSLADLALVALLVGLGVRHQRAGG